MDLGSLLDGLDTSDHPDLIVGYRTSDDAGVYRLQPGLALVQTVDFITPVSDDPFAFGQVAAANALSDVYAMGGRPVTALNICCFPAKGVPPEIYREILRGSLEKIRQAGAVLAGGHTVADDELKYGLSVTGLVDPAHVMTNDAARPGQILVLTKPLGTGIAIGAYRKDRADPAEFDQAMESMKQLNGAASRAAVDHGVRACTDVTGFGLAGHALEMARASGCAIRISWESLSILPGTLRHIETGIGTAMARSNRRLVGDGITFDPSLGRAREEVILDPQTSGGLLLSVDEDRLEGLLADLQGLGPTEPRVIGRVLPAGRPGIELVP